MNATPLLAVAYIFEFDGLPGQHGDQSHPDPNLRLGTLIRIKEITLTGTVRYTTGTRTNNPTGHNFSTLIQELPLTEVLALINTRIWTPTY